MKVSKHTIISDASIRFMLAVALVWLAVFSRLLPHPANITSVAAVAIFGGAILPQRWAVSLPLLSMVVSDFVIGLHPLIFFTWGSIAIIALLSSAFLKNIRPATLAVASIGASTLFFVVSNFGVWLEGKLYPHTWHGLVDCFYNALPFYRNTLLGDLLFTTILFGVCALAYKLAGAKLPVFAKR